jgi:hypothetical protein
MNYTIVSSSLSDVRDPTQVRDRVPREHDVE